MSWQFVSFQYIQGRQLPSPTLRFNTEFRWEGQGSIEISSARLQASAPDIPNASWGEVPLPLTSSELSSNRSMYLAVALPVHRSFIEAIEAWRQGRSNPVRFEGYVSFNYRVVEQFAMPISRDENGRTSRTIRTLGPALGDQARFSVTVQRDVWLEVLRGLGWSEFLVFEMAVRPLLRHERFKKAFEYLDHAQTALRQGQWTTAATESRRALEAAATAVAPDSDQKQKFAALTQLVFPEAHDDAKRTTLSSLMMSLLPLRNESAHGNNLLVQIEREDAELAFGVAVSVFRYIGEALNRRQ